MFGIGKSKKDPASILSEYEFIAILKEFANDAQRCSQYISMYPELINDDNLRRHAAALQWYAVHLYNCTINYKNLTLASHVKQAMESEATLSTKILYSEYMRNFDPLLEKRGRTAIDESFVEDIGFKFSEVCRKEVSAPAYKLNEFGKKLYRDTFNRCLGRMKGYKIQ